MEAEFQDPELFKNVPAESTAPPTAEAAKRPRVRRRGEDIRHYLLQAIEDGVLDVAGITASRFSISRQAVSLHVKRLIDQGAIVPDGKTRDRTYRLAPVFEWKQSYAITPEIAEDQVWSKDISYVLGSLPKNVLDIWYYCFTEMFNNAIDHSGGSRIFIKVAKTATNTQLMMQDNGVGIFKKIAIEMNLLDERHAILELAKGKLTTDPKKHTGQGIFFTSRMLDSFDILSGELFFTHTFGTERDWVLGEPRPEPGTTMFLKLDNHSVRTDKQIFDQYSSGDGYRFTKTVVPVKLAQFGGDKLISRSQAKRVLARVELFKTVLIDFEGVDSIGHAFADEVFRVFVNAHPEIEILEINANEEVARVIFAARKVSWRESAVPEREIES